MIYLLRKPFKGTLAGNTLKHGCGGLNIDACRVPTDEHIYNHGRNVDSHIYGKMGAISAQQSEGQKLGRWPANLLLSEEVFSDREESRYFLRFKEKVTP